MEFNPAAVTPSFTHTHPDGMNAHWEYSHQCELAVANAIFPSNVVETAPSGFCPEYDMVIRVNGKIIKYDQKMSMSVLKKDSRGIRVELRYNDGRPSALLLSASDYYLTLSQEYNKGSLKVKARFFSVPLLLNLAREGAHLKESFFYMKPFDTRDVWLGDFAVNKDDTWDLTKLDRPNPQWETQLVNYKQAVIDDMYTIQH